MMLGRGVVEKGNTISQQVKAVTCWNQPFIQKIQDTALLL